MSGADLTCARLKAAAHLMEAIAACHQADRAVLLCAALDTMAVGEPGVAFLHIRQEAEDWAKFATPQELEAYLLAGADQLEERRSRQKRVYRSPSAWDVSARRCCDHDCRVVASDREEALGHWTAKAIEIMQLTAELFSGDQVCQESCRGRTFGFVARGSGEAQIQTMTS